jgi:hypothetical protein
MSSKPLQETQELIKGKDLGHFLPKLGRGVRDPTHTQFREKEKKIARKFIERVC